MKEHWHLNAIRHGAHWRESDLSRLFRPLLRNTATQGRRKARKSKSHPMLAHSQARRVSKSFATSSWWKTRYLSKTQPYCSKSSLRATQSVCGSSTSSADVDVSESLSPSQSASPHVALSVSTTGRMRRRTTRMRSLPRSSDSEIESAGSSSAAMKRYACHAVGCISFDHECPHRARKPEAEHHRGE